jgi:hypothetical protein
MITPASRLRSVAKVPGLFSDQAGTLPEPQKGGGLVDPCAQGCSRRGNDCCPMKLSRSGEGVHTPSRGAVSGAGSRYNAWKRWGDPVP